MSQAVISI